MNSMPNKQIEDKVRTILSEQLGVDANKLKLSDSLSGNLGADSLDQVEIMMAIESEFQTGDLSEEEFAKIITMQQLVDFIDNIVNAHIY